MSHNIREYTHNDVDDIKKLLVELQEFERMMDPRRLEGIKIAHEYLEHLLELCEKAEGKIYVVEIYNEVIGMISVYIQEDKKHYRKTHRYAYISDLIVLPEYRDRGITKELLETAEKYAQSEKVDTIQTFVLTDHQEGIAGLQRNGYHQFEIILKKTLS